MRWICLCFLACVLWGTTYSTETECDPSQFPCSNGRCINLAWKCDGDDDCHDNSDEFECPATTCSENFFRCDDGKCIPERWICDDSSDCRDDSDEKPELCKNQTCNGYRCQESGQCIPKEWQCDGQPDCPKGDDETACDTHCDPDTEFECKDKKCISVRWKCDNHEDCDDGSDEVDCPAEDCSAIGEKKCDDGECINSFWWCDGDADCKDSSDEANCTDKELITPACGPTEFQCRVPLLEPQCIHFGWKCDGDEDCGDGSDEEDCADRTCRPDERMCDGHYCIKEEFFCDGEVDCQDGEDEKNCNYTVTPEPNCGLKEFDCGNGKCIPDSDICNGANDCGNDADEAPERHCPSALENTCEKSNGGCMQVCIPDMSETSGRRCECYVGFEFRNGSDTECDDIDECQVPGTCSQVCVNTKGSYKCECQSGYSLTNHRYCKASNGQHAELILSDKHELRRYHLDTFHYSRLLETPVKGAVAMDFDFRRDIVYWTDVSSEIVYSADVKTNQVHKIVENDVRMPDGLAVDWVHGNLYLSDTGYNRIEVARLNGSCRKTLVSDGLDEPRALVVDPYHGWMYWTDWGSDPKIEKCGMNGQHRMAIVTEGITWPNGLTIDYIQQRLYWVDAKLHTIGSSDLDGSNYQLVLRNHRNLGHPFAITVFEDYLYWTDWMSNSVHRVSKFSTGNGNVSTIALDLKTPMDIHVYHIFRQPSLLNHCGDNNGGCSHLCLPRPQMEIKSGTPVPKSSECACPDGMKLDGSFECIKSDVVVTTKKPGDKDSSNPNRPQTSKPEAPVTEKPGDDSGNPNRPQTSKPESPVTDKSGSSQEQESTEKSATTETSGNFTLEINQKDGEGVGHVAIIVIGIIAVIGIVAAVVIFFLVKRYKSRNVKSMNFDNPVYRKTTTDDSLIMEKNGSRANLPQSMQPLNQDQDIV